VRYALSISRLMACRAAAMATAGCAWRGAEGCVTAGHHRPSGSGDGPGVGRRARQRPHARGRGLSRRPGRGQSPALPGATGLVVLPVSVHALPLGQLAAFCDRGGLRPGAGVPQARP
jgi:hypothetical protein